MHGRALASLAVATVVVLAGGAAVATVVVLAGSAAVPTAGSRTSAAPPTV